MSSVITATTANSTNLDSNSRLDCQRRILGLIATIAAAVIDLHEQLFRISFTKVSK